MSKIWPATDLIGGAFGALDAIDGAILTDGDAAVVITPAGTAYHYTLDADSGAAESPPNIIAPDVNPGTKRWIFVATLLQNVNHMSFNVDPVSVPADPGTLNYDKLSQLLTLRTDIPGVHLSLTGETVVRIRNQTGSPIPDGGAVVGAGAVTSPITGDIVFLVTGALAVSGPLAGITGIATSEIDDDAEGWAVVFGDVHSYDTTPFTAMDELFVSATNPYELTNEAPSPPFYPIPIGYAKDSDADGTIFVFATNPVSIIAAVDAAVASGDPTGFHDGDNIDVAYDGVSRTITLTGDLKYSWRGQVKELESPWTSDPHPDVLGELYHLHSIDGENFIWTTTPWAFSDLHVAEAYYSATVKAGAREVHGLMPWQSHEEFHFFPGTYKTTGGTIADYVLDSIIAADRRPTIAETTIKDEDLRTVDSAHSSLLYTKTHLTGAGIVVFDIETADIVPLNVAIPYWNEFDGADWVQTPMANNSYMSVWLVAVPSTSDSESQKFRYMWIQGQSSGSLLGQESLFPQDLSLGDLTDAFDEFVFCVQVIIRYTAGDWRLENVKNLTGSRALQVGSPAGLYLSTVATDETITGDGTVGNPLGVVYLPSSKDHETITGTIDISANFTEHFGDFTASFTANIIDFVSGAPSVAFLFVVSGGGSPKITLNIPTAPEWMTTQNLSSLDDGTYQVIIQLIGSTYILTVGKAQ